MKKLIFWGCFLCVPSLFAWNAEGHRVVAQIAQNHMTDSAKARFQVAHPVLDKKKASSFTEAAVWLDTLRRMPLTGLDGMHYVDIPIASTPDNKPPEVNHLHALMAYTGARQMLLMGEGGPLKQVIALRILLHLTADLHQPLHAATRLTSRYPHGDAGGNKVRLPKNDVSRNLHAYWDRGAGFLLNPMPARIRASVLEKIWPCDLEMAETNPIHWLAESHVLAEKNVYMFHHSKFLSDDYASMAYALSQKRLAEAGCRLAAVLNEIDSYGLPVVG